MIKERIIRYLNQGKVSSYKNSFSLIFFDRNLFFFVYVYKKEDILFNKEYLLLIPLWYKVYASAGITDTKLLSSRPFLKHTVPSTNA